MDSNYCAVGGFHLRILSFHLSVDFIYFIWASPPQHPALQLNFRLLHIIDMTDWQM